MGSLCSSQWTQVVQLKKYSSITLPITLQISWLQDIWPQTNCPPQFFITSKLFPLLLLKENTFFVHKTMFFIQFFRKQKTNIDEYFPIFTLKSIFSQYIQRVLRNEVKDDIFYRPLVIFGSKLCGLNVCKPSLSSAGAQLSSNQYLLCVLSEWEGQGKRNIQFSIHVNIWKSVFAIT